MRKLLILLLSLGLTSCITQQKCNEKFPPVVKDSVSHDTLTILMHDTLFYPYQEVSIDTSGFLPLDLVFNHSVKKGRLTSTVSISNGRLSVMCAEDSLKLIIENLNQTIKIKESKTQIITKTEFKDHWYDPICRWWFIISLILFILLLLWKYLKI